MAPVYPLDLDDDDVDQMDNRELGEEDADAGGDMDDS